MADLFNGIPYAAVSRALREIGIGTWEWEISSHILVNADGTQRLDHVPWNKADALLLRAREIAAAPAAVDALSNYL
jgi:hypothetical protein